MAKKEQSKMQSKMNQIQEMRLQVEREAKKIRVQCSHQNAKGKLKIERVNDNNDFECKYCGTRFNMTPIQRTDLLSAVRTVTNALEQIRCYSDHVVDAKRIVHLGELAYNLQEAAELYEKTTDVYGRKGNKGKNKNKGKNRDDLELGSYGMGLSFMGSGNKRR